MALLYIDGFETYGNTANAVVAAGDVARRWMAFSENAIKVQVGRDGSGKCLSMETSSCRITKVGLNTTNDTLVVGVAMYLSSIGASAFQPIQLFSGATFGMNLQVNTDGSVSVRRGSTTLANSANSNLITANSWHYVELKVKSANSGGTFDVYINGVNELSGNGDTQDGPFSYHTAVSFRRGDLSSAIYFDDLYILDGTGATNNDVLGPMYVTTIYPDGDDTTDWTANGNGSHYSEVNDVVFDSSTYIESGTPTDQDIFTYGTVPSMGAVSGVQVSTVLRETDAESLPLKILAKSSGNTVNGGNQTMGSTDWTVITTVFVTDPDGANWNAITLNSTKFGVEVA